MPTDCHDNEVRPDQVPEDAEEAHGGGGEDEGREQQAELRVSGYWSVVTHLALELSNFTAI